MLRKLFLTGVLGAAFLLAGAGTAQADHDRNCGNRVRNEQYKLQREIQRHGYYSRQAQHRREGLLRLRRQCGISLWGWRDNDRDGRWGRDDRWDRNDRRGRNDRRWDRRDRDDRGRRDRDRNGWYWDGRNWRRR